MKNIHFNRKEGLLRNLDEKPKAKRKINWDKIVYFIILFAIIFFVFRYFFTKAFYVIAPGHVLFKSLTIRVPEDITIKEFRKFEGDSVNVGDTIFSYVSYDEELAAYNQSISGIIPISKSDSWEEKEIYQLNKNIALSQIEIEEKKNLITFYNQQITSLKNEVILEITPKSKIEFYQKGIEELNLEIGSIQKEITTYNNLIAKLMVMAKNNQQGSFQANNSGGGVGGASLRYYVSPIKGTITRLYKSDYEVALKSEDILNMHERENIYIKAFFEQEDLANFKEGDEVTVIFPDGETSIGHIKRFYFATYRLPDEFQKKYESTTRAIAADIFPIENESQIKWKAFYKMNVTVRISKW